jgi:hypothetical protein
MPTCDDDLCQSEWMPTMPRVVDARSCWTPVSLLSSQRQTMPVAMKEIAIGNR